MMCILVSDDVPGRYAANVFRLRCASLTGERHTAFAPMPTPIKVLQTLFCEAAGPLRQDLLTTHSTDPLQPPLPAPHQHSHACHSWPRTRKGLTGGHTLTHKEARRRGNSLLQRDRYQTVMMWAQPHSASWKSDHCFTLRCVNNIHEYMIEARSPLMPGRTAPGLLGRMCAQRVRSATLAACSE